jgi:hypothetical protein
MEFPKGLFANKPHEKAPDFIKAKLNIDREEFIAWLKDQPEKVNIDIRESKDGTKWFAAVNDWKPEKKAENEPEPIGDGDLPF